MPRRRKKLLKKVVRRQRNMRNAFYREYKAAAQAYVPQKVSLPPRSTLFARANVKKAILEATRRRVQLMILYRKIQDKRDSVEYYQIAPISFRYKKLPSLGGSTRKVLFAWDEERLAHQLAIKARQQSKYRSKYGRKRQRFGSLKNFVLRNILNCSVTNMTYPLIVKGKRVEIY